MALADRRSSDRASALPSVVIQRFVHKLGPRFRESRHTGALSIGKAPARAGRQMRADCSRRDSPPSLRGASSRKHNGSRSSHSSRTTSGTTSCADCRPAPRPPSRGCFGLRSNWASSVGCGCFRGISRRARRARASSSTQSTSPAGRPLAQAVAPRLPRRRAPHQVRAPLPPDRRAQLRPGRCAGARGHDADWAQDTSDLRVVQHRERAGPAGRGRPARELHRPPTDTPANRAAEPA